MIDYKNFNAIVCTGIGKAFVTYRKQASLSRLKAYFDTKYPNWTFMTIYDRKTNEKEVISRR